MNNLTYDMYLIYFSIIIIFILILIGILKKIKPGCPNCGSKNWYIENIAIGAYVPRAYCNNCKHEGNVEIGSKYDKKEYGGIF